ncbi:hypothetical protein GCM10009549_14040 [Streptomyces thermoalcalitolerans]|uniref:Tyr recombinase domain-containing protein n=1 Tax=Streptomyces thermoalcalitolerans TaxID=65605 RepID=A0ABP3YV97_9ACTN
MVARRNKAGEVTGYQVRWRLGGRRNGPWQTERFAGDEEGRRAAEIFRDAVNEAGQQWPEGWVKGRGYIDPAAEDASRFVFSAYARQVIERRTGVSERYREDCLRELETYILPTFGNCDIRSTEHFSRATISTWVNQMAQTLVWRGSKRKPMSPKTLKNLRGLLSSILEEATREEPPLRDRNPCKGIRLPRVDDDGVEDDGEDIEFLEPDEVAGIVKCLKRRQDQIFVRVAYGTGLRWGEITALAPRHLRNPRPGVHEVRVARAWKRGKRGEGFYLGPPKSRAGRRTVDISAGLWDELIELGVAGMAPGALVFHNGHGQRLVYSTFYDRWKAAVAEAKERRLIPEWKFPTFHDLRHSHAAALISEGHSLTYVQRRLGHESIQTTSDTYGHLLETARISALETIDRALGIEPAGQAADADDEEHEARRPLREPGRVLYVAHLGAVRLAFWDDEHARELAEQWAQERGGVVRVERATADWWIRSTGGRVGSDNGLKAVRHELPARAFIWQAGPAVYAVDGTEIVTDPNAGELRGSWVYDFEEPLYTDEPALQATEWRDGPAAETEARAWGPDRDAVREAFEKARADALRICGLHPARSGGGDRRAVR